MDIIYPNKYYSKIKEKFPELSDKQIEKICTYGLRALFMATNYNVDIKVQQKNFFAYFGETLLKSDLYFKYRKLKLTAKYRVLANRKKKPYSGKYYFVITEERYKKMKNKKGGKIIPYNDLTMYKLREEAELNLGSYLYEVDYPEDIGYKRKIPTTNLNHRLIAKRVQSEGWGKFEPIAFEDNKQKTVKKSKKKGGK